MKPNESIDKCTTCSTCVPNCPVTAATRKFNGPKLTGPSSERFRLFSKPEIEALDYCSNCKNCDMACPCGVKISTINMLARSHYCKQHTPPYRDWILSHGHFMGKVVGWMPHLLLRFGMTNPLTRQIMDWIGIDKRAPMPVYASKSFPTLFKSLKMRPSAKKVVFFAGCYINDYDPQAGLDLVWFLQQAGYEIIVPDFACCGVPLIANGFYDDAARGARANSAELTRWARLGVPVLVSCPSCALMLKEEYGELFPDIPDTAVFAPHIDDACEFVLKLLDANELKLTFKTAVDKLVYHAPCHLRAQGLGKPGLELARHVDGVDIEDLQAGCCGISGSYGFKKEKFDVSMEVGAELFTAVKNSQARFALSECGTCRLQIGHHTPAKVMHPLTWLRTMVQTQSR